MNASIEERLRRVFADVFEVTPDKISDDMSSDNTDGWDSMQSVVIASSVESEFDIQLSDEELVKLNSFASILVAVQARNV